MDHAGAIASNAGDDFHLIWAAKKCIEMLKADSKLNTMVVEGPAWEDSIQIQDQTQLLSIDLTEYYGGNSFESADSVVFSQLKYSAYNPEKEWNVSRMCSSSNNKKSNSVIRRMADTYKGFAKIHGDISKKVILKLVSNQHVSVDLLESVNECKNILLKHNYKRTADLLNQLSEEKRVIIEKLYSTTNLKSGLFIGFIKVLDLNNCGIGARDIHETEIVQQIGIWGFNNTKSSYNDLIMAIRKCMLPEGENTRINRNWIKAKLGVEEYNIFPAPDKIDPLQGKYIVKSGESDIVEAILSSTKKWICLHAIAGAGKTSFVRKLKMHLPMESVTVFYDCYGGGTFLQPYQARHKKEIAIRQICNTLASECKTELLLGSYNEDYLWWNAIKERLEQASRVVKDNNPEAVVAIIIDAADNSISASQLRHEECFLEKFLEMELPENIRIIVTARTERKSSLPYIEQAEVLPIPLFSKENSAEHLREKYVCADDNTCCEFHQLTKGNPRLQSYVLSSAALLDDVLDIIRPNGKTLDDIFKSFINSAKLQYTGMVDIGIWGYEMRSYPPLLNVLWNSDFLSSKKDNEGYHIPKHFVENFMDNGTEVLLGLENYNTEDRCSKNIILKSVVLEENRLADFVRELQIDSYAIYDYLYREEEWGEEKAFCVYSTCYDMGSFPDKSSDMKDPFAKGHFDLLNCNMCLSPSLFPEVGILSLKDLCARNNKSDKYHTYKWCEPVTESGYEKRGTYGYMVSINKEYLLSVLQKRSFDLVCKIQVEIEDEYSSYKSKQDKIKQEALWIMHKNGDIQVILLKEEKK